MYRVPLESLQGVTGALVGCILQRALCDETNVSQQANSTAAAVEDNRLGLYEIGKSFSEPHGRGIQSHRNRGRGPGRAKKRCKDAAGSPPIPCCQLDQGPISPRQLAAYIAGVAHALHNNHEEQGPLPQPVPNQATAGALWDWGLDNAQLPQSFLQQAVEVTRLHLVQLL